MADDYPPPWIAVPGLTPEDPATQGAGDAYITLDWLPFWTALSHDEKQAYLDRWDASPAWRAAIAERYDVDPAMRERDAAESAEWLTARREDAWLAKVPAVTLRFWIIKILATTLGETAGDTVSMTLKLGYLVGTAIFLGLLVLFVWRQIAARRFHPMLYWATIIASTTAGTTMADFATRSIGIGYPGGSLLLFACVVASLAIWHRSLGSIAVDTVRAPKAELFYWITITFSQTLGTALGDWTADTGNLGYGGAAIVFAAALALVALLYGATRVSRVALFWAAFILTRPLGAAVGDFLDKPVDHGGLDISRPVASAVLAVVILALILVLPQRAGRHPVAAETGSGCPFA